MVSLVNENVPAVIHRVVFVVVVVAKYSSRNIDVIVPSKAAIKTNIDAFFVNLDFICKMAIN